MFQIKKTHVGAKNIHIFFGHKVIHDHAQFSMKKKYSQKLYHKETRKEAFEKSDYPPRGELRNFKKFHENPRWRKNFRQFF